jgi:cell division protein FtsZ
MTMEEVDEASSYIKGEVSEDAEVFWGVVFDDSLGDEVQITVIATGIDRDKQGKVIRLRDVSPEEAEEAWTVRMNGESVDPLETPTFQRMSGEPEMAAAPEELNRSKKGFLRKTLFKDNLDYPTFLRAKAD